MKFMNLQYILHLSAYSNIGNRRLKSQVINYYSHFYKELLEFLPWIQKKRSSNTSINVHILFHTNRFQNTFDLQNHLFKSRHKLNFKNQIGFFSYTYRQLNRKYKSFYIFWEQYHHTLCYQYFFKPRAIYRWYFLFNDNFVSGSRQHKSLTFI